MKNKKRIITEKEQKVAADILIRLACIEMTDRNYNKLYKEVFEDYKLCTDPFTGLPQSTGQHYKSSFEYDKQTFEAKYDLPYEKYYGRRK